MVDNKGAIFVAKNHVTSDRSKHIKIKHFLLRDLINKPMVQFEYMPLKVNVADIFIKKILRKVLHELNHGLTNRLQED